MLEDIPCCTSTRIITQCPEPSSNEFDRYRQDMPRISYTKKNKMQ